MREELIKERQFKRITIKNILTNAKKRVGVAVSVNVNTAISINGLQVPSTYVDIYIDVWSQACQGIHIDVVVTELWRGGPSGCAGGGGGSWG